MRARYRIIDNANDEIDRLRDQSCDAFDEIWESHQVIQAARAVILFTETVGQEQDVAMVGKRSLDELIKALAAYDKYRKERL